MDNFKKDIVVPVNFSPDTENALEEAVFFSKKLNAKIHLINVIEITDWWNNLFLSKEIKDKLNQLSLDNLKNLTGKYPDIVFETQVLFGRIHEQILKYADDVSAGLIVLCDKHKKDSESKVLGSIVTHIITESKIPVVTIKDKIDTQIQNIVVPIDLSEDTDRQIKAIISFNEFCNARLHFVSILFDSYRNRNRRIRSRAKHLERKLKEYQIPYSINLIRKRKAYAYQDILEFSDNVSSDLIFLMTHKETSFDNYIGAFAHRIINYANVPVMTITSRAASSEVGSFVNKFIDPFGVFKP